MRVNVANEMGTATGIVIGAEKELQSLTDNPNRHLPGLQGGLLKALSGAHRFNPYRGEFPSDATEQQKAQSVHDKPHNKFDDWDPPTQADYDKLLPIYNQLPDGDPRKEALRPMIMGITVRGTD
jgi:hypothetical protein